MQILLTIPVLLIFWFLLSWRFDVFSIFMGFLSTGIVVLYHHDYIFSDTKNIFLRFFRLISYIPWLIYQIILANIDLVKRVYGILPVKPVIIEFEFDAKRETTQVILANSITLTPGTVTIDAGKKFIVHAIADDVAEGLLSGTMQKKVKEIDV